MCRCESRLVPCPGAGCGIRTSPRPPGSAAPPAERRPGSATRGLWAGREGLRRGHRGKGGGQREGKLMRTTRQALSANAGRGLTKLGRTGIQCHKGHSQSQRLDGANGQNTCNRTHQWQGYDRRRWGKRWCTKHLSPEESAGR